MAEGFMSEATGMILVQVPLWNAGTIKVVIALTWIVWPVKKTGEL